MSAFFLFQHTLTLIRLSFLRVVFPAGSQFDPPSYFKKNLSNVSITLYNRSKIYLGYAESEKMLTSPVIS